MKILVIDDATVMRVVIKTILKQSCGIWPENIVEASNGRDGITLYKKERPDIVFLDIKMPDQDGLSVVQALIKHDPQAVIIMVTASPQRNDVRTCISAGAKDYILKPPSPARMRKALMTFAPYVMKNTPPAADEPQKKAKPDAKDIDGTRF
ncbi:MAG: response regulator [Defluviitaleaceae bacterium]|nr:response regulator [Defluviitaleaceae bacterium]MCL2275047.1 response regulator [Defluviitaleaceae bacterium]